MTQPAGQAPVTILLVHGPNLNLLGERNPAVYGRTTLLDIENAVAAAANARSASLISFQSNHEGSLVDFFHEHRGVASGAILNAGALTHTSVALRDALEAVALPVVEVHLSNIHAREPFRHISLTAGVCIGVVTGLGPEGYTAAVDLLLDHIERARAAATT